MQRGLSGVDAAGQADRLVIAVDLGGTLLRAALFGLAPEPLALYSEATRPAEGPDSVVRRLIEAVRRLGETTGWDSIAGVGISSPGPLDSRQGVVLWTPNLPGWRNVPLAAPLCQAIGRPVIVENDANLGALAEQRNGAGKGHPDVVYLTVSTGIGGGIISGGRLVTGHRGVAGEIGHVVIDPNGPPCNCGRVGCLEALASGTGIARQAKEMVNRGEPTLIREMVGGDTSLITAKTVCKAAEAGDRRAIELFTTAGRYLGLGIANLSVLLNPGIVVVGGSVTKAGDLLFEPMHQTIRAQIDEIYRCPVVPALLGDTVALVGAAELARDHLSTLGE